MPDRPRQWARVSVAEGLRVDGGGLDLARLPRRSGDDARDARDGDPEDVLIGTRRWPLHEDEGFELGDAGGDLGEAQAQGIELDGSPDESFRHRGAPRDASYLDA